MTAHLSDITLNALVDGELSVEQSAAAKEHLDQCPACTSSALNLALLKTATARAGQRYALPSELQERLRRLASAEEVHAPRTHAGTPSTRLRALSSAVAIAAMLLAVAAGWILTQRHAQTSELASLRQAALVTEVSDQHIATLAANQPPEVISSDRHTVKPWFQGKLPFSFNLPDNLPQDTKLDGANLTYLHNRPVAQLLYSIGRHHVSVFVQQRSDLTQPNPPKAEHSGFHVVSFQTGDLEFTAVSDVDPARLSALAQLLEQSQTAH
ncbi:MAG TPA: zf-HC2 domain-containing protein [Acidobacteriaceae bacterium]|nr:zf-HC2 domain-containing protein [Acidobacteriaceae bacterium]